MVDQAVAEVLAGCRELGAEVSTVYLLDENIEFCRNCRLCMQQGGDARGDCPIKDDMPVLLDRIEAADALVLGAPVNCYNVNAITRRFMERLVCYGYWPWGKPGPENRIKVASKRAVLVTSTAMPAFLGRIATGAIRALKAIATLVGAKPVGTLFIGLAAMEQEPMLSPAAAGKARKLGHRLVARGKDL